GLSKPVGKHEYYHVAGTTVTHYTDGGATIHALSHDDVAKLLGGEVPAAPAQKAPEAHSESAKPAVPEGSPIQVTWKNYLVGEVPAGSKIYKYKTSAYGGHDRYIHLPGGGWTKASSQYSTLTQLGGSLPDKYDKWLAEGKLEEVAPPTPELVAQIKEA